MPLESVHVAGLFGTVNHDIPLNHPDRITILHGPNGVGKTTVLRLVFAALRRRFGNVRRVPFESLELRFPNRNTIRLERHYDDPDDRAGVTLTVALVSKGRVTIPPSVVGESAPRDLPIARIDDFLPWLSRVAPREWWDTELEETLDLDDVLELYGDQLPIPERTTAPEPIVDLLRTVPAQIIETQRLSVPLTRRRPRRAVRQGQSQSAVNSLADDLMVQMRGELARYAEVSQSLDQTFPSRLLEHSKPPPEATDDAIRARYDEQARNRDHLIDAGLLDPGAPGAELVLPTRKLTTAERNVLWTYLRDVDDKLETLNEIAAKIDLFREIVNTKFEGKSVEIQRGTGFIVRTDRGEELDPRFLSSGEQHELVLGYRLLFDVDPGSLILIDEPELSLHVSWQQQFLPDIERISKLAKLDFLLATHSPTIVGSRWDLTEGLSLSAG